MTLRAVKLVLLCGLLLLTACASGGGGSGPDAGDEMKLGVKAARRGYWQEALTRFEQARAKRPHDVEILNNVAIALEAVGRYEEALETYEMAIAIDPGDRNVQRNMVLFNEFYNTYVVREDDNDEPGEDNDDD